MKPTEKDYGKFNKLLKFFVQQWEENARYEGRKGGKASYCNIAEVKKWDRFINFGISKDIVNYDCIPYEILFKFDRGHNWNRPSKNFLMIDWIHIEPTFDNKKIIALKTIVKSYKKFARDTP